MRWPSTRSSRAACISAPRAGRCTRRPMPATTGRPSSVTCPPSCRSRSRRCDDPRGAAAAPAGAGAGEGRGDARRPGGGPGHAAGQYVAASPLEPTATATSVRVRGGKQVVRDGPFAETKEQLGGYFLIDASDLDEAIAIAARIPMARRGTVEVRPVVQLADLPPD